MAAPEESLAITIQGVVQGVGFRPFIYGLARELRIRGYVANSSVGVIIRAEGSDLVRFIERIRKEAPPLSRIDRVDIRPADAGGYTDFSIRQSDDAGGFTLLSPDISICDDCMKELFSRTDRRFGYPFINCTNCGPRYSITMAVPYDRGNTTMRDFKMCGQCAAEYHDPLNRRFHAQPNACPVCGPHVFLMDERGGILPGVDPIGHAIAQLRQGKILAVRGLGGFHIACDAGNKDSVELLRERKRRSNKPFALMASDISFVRNCCTVTPYEEELLRSRQRPVVLLRKKVPRILPDAVAPGNAYLGFMLPYTPLHYLLFHAGQEQGMPDFHPHFPALVMTSGNLSEEPILRANEEAVERLAGIVDGFLVHNRDIFMRVDDSVLRIVKRSSASEDETGMISFIRRSRGYAPEPVRLRDNGPVILACGADVKNTFALTRGAYAIVSQHIGDMENYETLSFFEDTFENLRAVYRAEPEAVAYDLHPRYLSASWAMDYAAKKGLRMAGIQHHYAHIGSVMAEHGLKDKVVGVAFDGSGYGSDGTLWGGEFLIADTHGFSRAGHLKPVPLPGGEMAVREPWRVALSYLKEAYGAADVIRQISPTGFLEKFGRKKIDDILRIAEITKFSPLSSGAGRLFDAVSAMMGLCDRNTFEGEASMALESLAAEGIDDAYPADIRFGDSIEIDFSFALHAIVDDLRRNADPHVMAAKFHNAVGDAVIRVVLKLSLMNNIKIVALSGGAFQNLYLAERISGGLKEEGLSVYLNERVPCNDAGVSLGQAYLAREMIRSGIHA